jgi:peptidoglycan/xylan/chitin deacetylase (PgdA/CDA1 family)
MFHSVLPQKNLRLHLRNNSTSELSLVVNYLRDVGEIIPLQQWVDENKNGQFALTFDDGLVNNLQFAAPLLSKKNIPATYFINTPSLDNDLHIWTERVAQYTTNFQGTLLINSEPFKRSAHNKWLSINHQRSLMDWLSNLPKEALHEAIMDIAEQTGHPNLLREHQVMQAHEIRELSKMKGVSIGSHGIDHRAMTTLNDTELKRTLEQSKVFLEQHTDQNITMLAFPFGDVNRKVYDIALKSGYRQLFGVDPNPEIPELTCRFGLYNHNTIATQLHALLSHK